MTLNIFADSSISVGPLSGLFALGSVNKSIAATMGASASSALNMGLGVRFAGLDGINKSIAATMGASASPEALSMGLGIKPAGLDGIIKSIAAATIASASSAPSIGLGSAFAGLDGINKSIAATTGASAASALAMGVGTKLAGLDGITMSIAGMFGTPRLPDQTRVFGILAPRGAESIVSSRLAGLLTPMQDKGLSLSEVLAAIGRVSTRASNVSHIELAAWADHASPSGGPGIPHATAPVRDLRQTRISLRRPIALTREGFEHLAANGAVLGFWTYLAIAGASVVGKVMEQGWLAGADELAFWTTVLVALYATFVARRS